jgi:hypothetical protein
VTTESYETIKLQKSDQAMQLLESRKIIDDEIKMVIHNAETKGEKLYQQSSKSFLAKLRIANATIYVEYSPTGEDEYEVHTAYSHRAQLAEE